MTDKTGQDGLIHLYYGDGKGKTTAAIGLAIRALGAGKKVVFLQCMKSRESGEHKIFNGLPGLLLLRCQEELGFYWNMTGEQKERLRQIHNENLDRALSAVSAGACDLLVLDEITYPLAYDLIDAEKVYGLLTDKPEQLELVLTGREPNEALKMRADYMTEMCARRHPYEKGVSARKGIEY